MRNKLIYRLSLTFTIIAMIGVFYNAIGESSRFIRTTVIVLIIAALILLIVSFFQKK